MDKKERKEFLKKKKEFLKKVEDEPNNASNYSILGEIFEHLTKKGAACKNYKRSLELKYNIPSNTKNFELKHNILSNGKVKLLFLKRSTNKSVYDVYSYLINGIISFDNENYRDAITNFDEAIKLVPNENIIYYYKGLVYFYSVSYDTAIKNFKIALNLKNKLEEKKI
ncbi:hypothetical protein ACW0S4_03005 [Fusobacterium polymorphum]